MVIVMITIIIFIGVSSSSFKMYRVDKKQSDCRVLHDHHDIFNPIHATNKNHHINRNSRINLLSYEAHLKSVILRLPLA